MSHTSAQTQTRPSLSFEVFPPKSLEATFQLGDALHRLAPLQPDFVSVTYGAGGTTRALTHEVVTTIGRTHGLRVAAHLTCVGASRTETLDIASRYAAAGVTDLVALRGDMPENAPYVPHPDGFTGAVDLVEALAEMGKFDIRVAAYPDPHPESRGMAADIAHLRAKVDAGASAAITQFFFEPETFLRYRDACVAAGIDVPIIPGILPIVSWEGTRRFAQRCGVPVPQWLSDAYDAAHRDGREELLSVVLATETCDRLLCEGVMDLHFYTLNRPHLSRDVCHALGLGLPAALDRVA